MDPLRFVAGLHGETKLIAWQDKKSRACVPATTFIILRGIFSWHSSLSVRPKALPQGISWFARHGLIVDESAPDTLVWQAC